MSISEQICKLAGIKPELRPVSNGVEFIKDVEVFPDFEENDANFVKLLVKMSKNSKSSWLENFKSELQYYRDRQESVFSTDSKIEAIQNEKFEYETVIGYDDPRNKKD